MVLHLNIVSTNKKIIIILGPNASGKSNLGVLLAQQLDGEIISADSRQVYKGLNIGSGKITKKEMGGIKHYCLDITNPKRVFTAYDFQKCARQAMEKIWQKGKTPIIVGGTGFYIDAAIGRVKLSNIPPNPKLRKKLQKFSTTQLFSILKKLDPKRAKNIDKNNGVRLVRAIEIATKPHPPTPLSFVRRGSKRGKTSESQNGFFGFFGTVSEQKRGAKKHEASEPSAGWAKMSGGTSLVYPRILWIGIKRKPEDLKKRIHKRLVTRIPGIIKEIKKLRQSGISWKRLFELGLEYRYVSLYIRGKLSKSEMIKKLETEINKYAKRQMTYFKRNKEICWISTKKEINDLLTK